MPKLIIARHGVTPYNEAGIWTGITDVDMSERGYEEVRQVAEILVRYSIDVALSSVLMRARNTAKVILALQANKNIPLLETPLLNEKDYGIFTGKNKQVVRSEFGEDAYLQIRRGWDDQVEDVETLKDIYTRVIPVHEVVVIPILQSGRTVLVSAHNNTLRAYVKELEAIPDDQVSEIELGTAEARVYDFDDGVFVLEDKHIIGDVH